MPVCYCGEPVVPPQRKYCSPACSTSAKRAKDRQWREANPEKQRGYEQRWREANLDKIRDRVRRWREANPEKRREQVRRQRAANPETNRAQVRRHRALKKGAHAVEKISLEDLFERDGGVCHICRKKVAWDEKSMDHLIPLSQGGSHTWDNVALAHRNCNAKRGPGRIPAQLRLLG